MKKIFLVLLLLLPLAGAADNVSPERAQQIAERFFAGAATRAASPVVKLKWTGDNVQTRTSQQADFYVFDNLAGGFVIVAGDDLVEPILGYSDSGEFRVDNMPANVKYWFRHLSEGIAYLRSKGAAPSERVQEKWRRVAAGALTRGGVGAGGGRELETALWDQTDPYNIKASAWCNFEDGVYTGCVATATAIIMRYHNWPEFGTGNLPGYSYQWYRYRTVRGYSLGHTYDWNNMPLRYNNSATTEQKNAVAQLMLDCGVMVQMSYGTYSEGGSGAITAYVPAALIEHMGYDRSIEPLERGMYPHDTWVSRIVDNIDNVGPVLFEADSDAGGHAFVLDGYDRELNMHINWGWSGYDNGYYTVPDFGDFLYSQNAYINIKPDAGGRQPDTFISLFEGMSYLSGPTDNGAGQLTMTVNAGFVGNGGLSTFYGNIYLAHADKKDNFKSQLYKLNVTSGLEQYYGYRLSGLYFSIDKRNIAAGDKIKWFYELAGRGEMLPVKVNTEYGYLSELPLPSDDEKNVDIEAETSVRYDAVSKVLVVKTRADFDFKVMQESGRDVTSGIEFGDGELMIDTSVLGAGTYTLQIIYGMKSKELQFVVGE